MKIQLPVRWVEKKEIDEDEATLKKLLDPEAKPDEDLTEEDFTYGKIVLDTKDIKSYNELDEEHVIVRTYAPESYCIAVGFEDFKKIMIELTGESVITIEKKVVTKEKQKPSKKKKDSPKKDEDEDFLD